MSEIVGRRAFMRGLGGGLGLLGFQGLGLGQPLMNPDGPRPAIRHPEGRHINLAGNENPFGPAPAAAVAIAREISNSIRYPWREETVLREVIASYEGVGVDQIVLTNGCDELLAIGGTMAADDGGNLVASTPSYDWLGRYCERRGGEVRWVLHEKGTMRHDLAGFKKAIDGRTSMVYICNPDTPSGTMLQRDVLRDFIRSIDPRVIVFLDEVYLDLLDDFPRLTLTELTREFPNFIVGRSFSKLYALAGHRVGYAVTSVDMAGRISRYKTSSMNYLGVIAAQASLYDERFRLFSRSKIKEGRDSFCRLLEQLGLRFIPSVGNFVFHHTGIPIREYQEQAKEAGFLVGRPFEPYNDWCRISIGNESEMRSFASFMRQQFDS